MRRSITHGRGRSIVALALLGVMLAACKQTRPRPRPVGDPAESVLDVRVVGADAFEAKDLRRGLDTRDAARNADPYSPRQVSIDEQRLRAHYVRHGFFDAEVTSALEERKNGVIVTFRIQEGHRATVKRISFEGLPADVKAADLRDALTLEEGDRFDYETYQLDVQTVLQQVKRGGYAHADVRSNVLASGENRSAELVYTIDPGPPVTFGTIELNGTSGELGDAAKARVKMKEGARYTPDDVVDTQTALYDLGRFSSVRVELRDEGAPEVMPAVITVVEAPRNEWRLGGGAGADPAEYQIRARASYSILGWPRPLMNTRLDLRPKISWLRDASEEVQPGAEASARLERLDLFRPHLRGEALVAFERDAYELYTSYGVRVRLGADSPIGKRVRVGAGWQFRGLRFDEISDAVPMETQDALGFGDYYRLAFLEQAISVDLRDDPVQPTLGVYGEIRAEEGGPWAGSEFSYAKITPEIRGYVGQRWAVLAGRLRVGSFVGDLPLTQRYFAGGASSQRGFPERRLAPTVTGEVDGETESVVIGGGALIETGLELRIPLGKPWGAEIGTAIFLDGADVTEDFDQLDPMNLHWATGAGLRLGTPIGPARFDVGYRVTRRDELRRGENLAFHLSLGHTF